VNATVATIAVGLRETTPLSSLVILKTSHQLQQKRQQLRQEPACLPRAPRQTRATSVTEAAAVAAVVAAAVAAALRRSASTLLLRSARRVADAALLDPAASLGAAPLLESVALLESGALLGAAVLLGASPIAVALHGNAIAQRYGAARRAIVLRSRARSISPEIAVDHETVAQNARLPISEEMAQTAALGMAEEMVPA